MGYHVEHVDSDFFVAAEVIPSLIETVRNLVESGQYSWIRDDYKDSEDVVKIFNSWRWNIEQDKHGNIVGIGFLGEKLGDDEVFFKAIAPFVKHDSFIEMVGEDHAMWRWKFVKGKMKELYPEVIWSDR
jgi:hypothetical protein